MPDKRCLVALDVKTEKVTCSMGLEKWSDGIALRNQDANFSVKRLNDAKRLLMVQ